MAPPERVEGREREGGWAGGQRWVKVRLLVAAGAFVALFGLVGYKAWVLQVREAERLTEMAEDQYLRDVELPARRGRILDRNGAELAVSVETDSIYVNARQIEKSAAGVEGAARALARPLGMERKELEKKLSSHRYFTWLRRRVPPDEARLVRELNLTGVYLTREPRRYYPNRSLAGQVLGWAGMDGTGLEGLELRYDKDLKGSPAEVQGLRDALGREVFPGGMDALPQAGHDVVTTFDKFIQYRLEKALEAGVEQHHARAASALVLDPRTGEVLAMASVPIANPNDPPAPPGPDRRSDAVASFNKGPRNRPVTDPFEPGSTMKAFTLAAAFEAGLIKLEERWFCENGKMQVGPSVIHDAERIGWATTIEVLAKSSNICTAKIARRLGRDRLDAALRRFGFGTPTGVDLPGERAGQLRPPRRWGEIELATISFGQGMTATQLQLASGYAALANGGILYRPHAVRRVLDEKGAVLLDVAPDGHRVVDEGVARAMRTMLRAVNEKGGTGEKLAIPGYPSGGKTGTAQKVDPMTRKYSTDKWVSSYIGFAPLVDPRLVIIVTVDEPLGTHYGSQVAGPIWREVMIESLRYLNVTPTGVVVTAPSAPTPPPLAAAPHAVAVAPPTAVDGVGSEESQDARDDGELQEIPDFTGLSIGEALALARRAHLPVDVVGSGRAASQTPGPGRAREGARCRITFAPPS